MPFGIGLLDLLNQGGQFIAGRQAQQQANQKAALEAALLQRRQAAMDELSLAQAAEARARAAALANPQEKPLTEDTYSGLVSSFSSPDLSALTPKGEKPPTPTPGQIASNTLAHTGLSLDGSKINPAMVMSAAQKFSDQRAQQARQDASAARQESAAERAAAAQERAADTTTATNGRALANDFKSSVKSTTDQIQALDQATTTLGEATQGNRAAYGSAIANFVQAVDQKAQLRYQMMQYFTKEIDPTIGGRWNILKDKLLKGEYPDSVLNGMRQHLNSLKQMDVNRYNQRREAEIKRHPVLKDWLPDVGEFMGGGADIGSPFPGGPKPAGAAPIVGAFHDLIPGS
jgi:hypothetical protein